MTDLLDALRPPDTDPSTPVEVIVERARRRSRHRRRRNSGLAVALMAGGLITAINLKPSETSSTVAVGSDSTSIPGSYSDADVDVRTDESAARSDGAESDEPAHSTSTPTTQAKQTTAAPPDGNDSIDGGNDSVDDGAGELRTTPGLRTTVTTSSSWDTGYCQRVEVVNESDQAVTWQVVLTLDGTLATNWASAVTTGPGDALVFVGEPGFNETLEPGAVTSFGLCVDR